jgi:large repetitive protein
LQDVFLHPHFGLIRAVPTVQTSRLSPGVSPAGIFYSLQATEEALVRAAPVKISHLLEDSRIWRPLGMRAGWLLLASIVFFSPTRVFAAVTVTITPSAVNLAENGSQQFTATVTGATDTSVTWSVEEGSSGGTVNGSGLYSAPSVLGTFHVVATSNADGTQSAIATVTMSGFIHTGLIYAGPCTATGLPGGMLLYTGGQIPGSPLSVQTPSSNAEIYDPVALKSTPTGNMTIPRCGETATLLPNGQVLFAGGLTAGGATATAELYDPVAGTFSSTGSMSVPRTGHTATLLSNGLVLIAGGENCNSGCVYYNSAELFNPSSGTFSVTAGGMTTPYTGAAAVLLATGKVLIAGGTSSGAIFNTIAELFDPSTNLFALTGTMVNPRQAFTATLLQNGNVLLAGGQLSTGTVTSDAEIYDPSTGLFAPTGSMNIPRDFHTASMLLNGQVLIAGGGGAVSRPTNAELYDPVSGTFLLTGSLEETRLYHTATAQTNGTVVIAGGFGGQLLSSVESYNPTTAIFTSQSVFMSVARAGHAATQLADGRVLFTGGQDAFSDVNSSAEIYDPASGQFSLTGSLIQGRFGHTATLLENGNVLVVGGYSDPSGSTLVSTAELYSPVTGIFSPTSNPNVSRAYHTATLLQSGEVLIAGGQIGGSQTTTSTELYDPNSGSFTLAGNMSAPRYNHTATLLNDGRVLIAEGVSGTGGGIGNLVGPDDLYDPTSGLFTQVGTPFEYSRGIVIPFDSVLLASGQVFVDQQTIFDPTSNTLSTFNPASSLDTTLQDYKFSLLPSGQVFVSGGGSSTYLFDPTSETYTPAGGMNYIRSSPTVKLLSTGEVLVAGGATIAQAEIFVPPAPSSNASPILSSIIPSSVVAGGPGFTLSLSGFNFVSNSVVNFNSVARQTTFVSATALSIAILASDIASVGSAAITVTNPLNGSSGGGTSNPISLAISPPNVQPVVGTLSPASAAAGGPAFLLTVSGSNFSVSSVVSFNGNATPTTFSSTTELQASIPASAIAVAGTPIVTVSNPGSLPSTVVTFTVNNPVPQVSSLTPSSAPPGSGALTLDVSGTNFNSSSNILINGAALPTAFLSSTLIQAILPASDLAQGGTLNVAAENPAPGGGTSAALPFTLAGVNLQPVVGVLSPASATAGGPPFTLTLSGSNFTSGSVVSLNGSAMATAFSSATELQASIPASAIAVAGTPVVTVANPGGNPSTVVTFTVNNPIPQENQLSPTIAVPGSAALTLNVAGSNFNASSSVLINGAAQLTTYVSSTLLQATLPASDLAQGGTLNVVVKNPAPGGGITLPSTFTVADFVVSAQTSSDTVNAGQTATYNLLVQSAPSNVTYTNPITFAATGLPTGATASFAPSASIILGAAAPTVTLTVVTAAPSAAHLNDFPHRTRPALPSLGIIGMALALSGLALGSSGRRVPRIAPQFLWALLLVALVGLGACGSPVTGSSPPAQSNPDPVVSAANYTITITATSGTVSHSTSVTLTVM